MSKESKFCASKFVNIEDIPSIVKQIKDLQDEEKISKKLRFSFRANKECDDGEKSFKMFTNSSEEFKLIGSLFFGL